MLVEVCVAVAAVLAAAATAASTATMAIIVATMADFKAEPAATRRQLRCAPWQRTKKRLP
eukprot:5653104-Pleurochrysis_carterae.AAC.2